MIFDIEDDGMNKSHIIDENLEEGNQAQDQVE